MRQIKVRAFKKTWKKNEIGNVHENKDLLIN